MGQDIEIRLIDERHKADINIPNDPFSTSGRFVPSYANEEWKYEIHRGREGEIGEMTFPDENYDYDAMRAGNVFIGAYGGGKCIGLAIMQHAPLKYMYLHDLKVNKAFRRKGAGRMLMDESSEIALANGYNGIYTIAQDNNLGACLFYMACGFVIGGLDTRIYKGTPQENKKNILFYLDLK